MTVDEMSLLLQKSNLNLTLTQKEQFSKYMNLLIEWNEKINLTAIKNPGEIVEKHFYDSLLINQVQSLNSQKVIDIGSGAGLPGIPLKIAFPELEVTLLEPTNKKVMFLNIVIKELGLSKIIVINDRAENISAQQRENYDVAIARAVAPLNVLNELCLPFIKVNGIFIALKGPIADEEVCFAANSLLKLSSHIETIYSTNLITNNDVRKIIVIKKDHPISSKYPRKFAEIKKKPL
ncbi:MAG: 16S rRNA (guanine(527)-N(7))-methyltransferase RsmG [Firmicutes bacterium]|nr:16S rRNA (guanine(527)-N(7))-methyltransferase RsmG [Bacillota bacterium]